jgi:hypothetical protein
MVNPPGANFQSVFIDAMTQHPNSILNPDVVVDWLKEIKTRQEIVDRASRARALLPSIERYFWNEIPRATKAVELWEAAAREYGLTSRPSVFP